MGGISKSTIELVIVDIKDFLAKEGESKLYGKSREWVCQLYEILLVNAELQLQLNNLFVEMFEVKAERDRLLFTCEQKDREISKITEEKKKWWKI